MERGVASRTTLGPAVCQVRGQGVLRAGLGPVGRGPWRRGGGGVPRGDSAAGSGGSGMHRGAGRRRAAGQRRLWYR